MYLKGAPRLGLYNDNNYIAMWRRNHFLSDRVIPNQSYIEGVDPPPQGGGHVFLKIF